MNLTMPLANHMGMTVTFSGLPTTSKASSISLSLGHDIRPTRLDFELFAFGRVDADPCEVATVDGIHLVAAITNQIGPTLLGHIQENAHVREVAAGANDAVLHPGILSAATTFSWAWVMASCMMFSAPCMET